MAIRPYGFGVSQTSKICKSPTPKFPRSKTGMTNAIFFQCKRSRCTLVGSAGRVGLENWDTS
eukprot:11105343-Alexandrium_andersonii.AAC.1